METPRGSRPMLQLCCMARCPSGPLATSHEQCGGMRGWRGAGGWMGCWAASASPLVTSPQLDCPPAAPRSTARVPHHVCRRLCCSHPTESARRAKRPRETQRAAKGARQRRGPGRTPRSAALEGVKAWNDNSGVPFCSLRTTNRVTRLPSPSGSHCTSDHRRRSPQAHASPRS